ncbi:MAG: hypothetical protein RBT02_02670 [Bacteroidales bacterium]|jgi:hypothetical protein|nr:hypothetical protein [Bacteroidales bacterium]
MSEKTKKLTMYLSWALMAITLVFAMLFYFGGIVQGTEGTRYEEPLITNSFIFYTYILIAITVLLTLFFSVRALILNPKGLKLILVAVGIGAVLMVIAALLADDTVLNLPHYKGKGNVPRTLLWTDIGLYVAYFLVVLAIIAILYSEISKYFTK